ncbi:hypothetical protein ACQKEX_15080 [Bacillus pumilus]|nr:hypothetical protein [Bacillus pumilus]OLP64320.1 hypothetical protein BACPU_25450 [Bacillus pumilus]
MAKKILLITGVVAVLVLSAAAYNHSLSQAGFSVAEKVIGGG